jgi:hypothetical protein
MMISDIINVAGPLAKLLKHIIANERNTQFSSINLNDGLNNLPTVVYQNNTIDIHLI